LDGYARAAATTAFHTIRRRPATAIQLGPGDAMHTLGRRIPCTRQLPRPVPGESGMSDDAAAFGRNPSHLHRKRGTADAAGFAKSRIRNSRMVASGPDGTSQSASMSQQRSSHCRHGLGDGGGASGSTFSGNVTLAYARAIGRTMLRAGNSISPSIPRISTGARMKSPAPLRL